MRFWQHKWVRRLVVWVLLPVVLGVGYYQYNYPTCTFRYKLTAEVMTPQGLKTGSSVIEVSYSHNADWGGGHGVRLNAIGEAVFVPIDQKRLFAVTLTGSEARRSGKQFRGYYYEPQYMWGVLDVHALPLLTFGLNWKIDERDLCRQVETVAREKRRFTAPFPNLPTLVVFEDINDPDSLKIVQPDNLAAALGTGHTLKNVWLEMTDKQPTISGMKIFPWWAEKELEQKQRPRPSSLISNILDSAFRRPGIWDNNQ